MHRIAYDHTIERQSAHESRGPPPDNGRWCQQFPNRPIGAWLTSTRALRDRQIPADGKLAWALTQLLKDVVNISPAQVQRVDSEMAAMKIDSYDRDWSAATHPT